MFIPLLGLLVPVIALGGIVTALRRPSTVVVWDDAECVRHLRRRRRVVLGLAVLAGAVAALLMLAGWPGLLRGRLGLGAALAPGVGLAGLLAVVCVGELTSPRASGQVRSASLRTRRVRQVLPSRSAGLATAGVTILAGLLVIGWAMGDADDQGRPGRALSATCRPGNGLISSTHGPWPGAYYAVPMLVGLLVAVVLASATVLAITQRAKPFPNSGGIDDLLRHAAVRRVCLVVAATTILASVPVAVLMAGALVGVECRPRWYDVLGVVLTATALAAAGLGAWALGAALVRPRFEFAATQPVSPAER